MRSSLTIVCAARLHANQLERHLELFEHIPEVGSVIVVRHAPLSGRLSKVQHEIFRDGSLPGRALGMARKLDTVLARVRPDLVIGFNPVPWGSLALTVAQRHGIPTCLSLIGMDYLQIQHWWGWPFLRAVQAANTVTVTGARMLQGLPALGVQAERIHILPHSIDTQRFVARAVEPEWDVLTVGQLLPRKRMDIVLLALARARSLGLRLRLGVLGKGPLERELRVMATELGITDSVDFLGYRDDVESVVARARTFCLASDWEGTPFALMEAMSAGLVPVVTDVGTVSDWVQDGVTGRLIPPGSPEALSAAWISLFHGDGVELARVRQNLDGVRNRLSFRHGAEVWRRVLGLPVTLG